MSKWLRSLEKVESYEVQKMKSELKERLRWCEMDEKDRNNLNYLASLDNLQLPEEFDFCRGLL